MEDSFSAGGAGREEMVQAVMQAMVQVVMRAMGSDGEQQVKLRSLTRYSSRAVRPGS